MRLSSAEGSYPALGAMEDLANERMAFDVLVRELDKGGVFDAGGDVFSVFNTSEMAVVGLLGVTGENHFRASAEASEDTEEHFRVHLLDFIYQHEGTDEGASTAPANGNELEFSFCEVLHKERATDKLGEVIQDATGERGELLEQVTGEGSEVFAEGGGDAADDQDFFDALFVKQFEGDG